MTSALHDTLSLTTLSQSHCRNAWSCSRSRRHSQKMMHGETTEHRLMKHVCVRACMHVYVRVCMCVCVVCMCMCACVCACVCMCVCACVCVVCVCVCVHVDCAAITICVRYCPSCKEHREATKQMSVWRLPDVLVVHLKRFSQQNMVIRGKLDKFVRYPTRCMHACVRVCMHACVCVCMHACVCVCVCVRTCVCVCVCMCVCVRVSWYVWHAHCY